MSVMSQRKTVTLYLYDDTVALGLRQYENDRLKT